MKNAKQMRELAKANNAGEELLSDTYRLIEIDAERGLFQSFNLIDKEFTLLDVDYVISELVAMGYDIDTEPTSESFLTKLKISW